MPLPKVVLIGDSVMGAYRPVVQRQLDGFAETKSFGGSTSRYVLEHLDELISGQPDIVHLNCGLHDLLISADTDKVQVPLDEYKANLEKIFRRILRETHAKLIWTTTTPVNEQRQLSVPPPKGYGRIVRREADVKVYNRASIEIAERLSLNYNDLFAVVMRAGRDKHLGEDGIHFNEAGNELLGQAVAKAIRSSLIKPRGVKIANPHQ